MTSRGISSFSAFAGAFAWLACLLAPPASASEGAAAVEDLRIEQPRGFGFQLGDQFERTVRLRLRHPYKLVLESFPPPGRMNRWVAFHSYDIETQTVAGADQHAITLRYQVVNVEPAETDAGVPGHKLEVSDGDETRTFFIPPSRTVITPFGEMVSAELAPDIAPAALPINQKATMLYAAVLLAAALGFCGLHFGWFRRNGRPPFAEAHRRLRQFSHDALTDDEYSAALRSIHEAFNRTAGYTLFPEQFAAFFDAHPGFARMRDDIAAYFARSSEHFFAASRERYTLHELIAFVRRCRDIERGTT